MRVNVEGTCSLMRKALSAGVERIVYTSSVAALTVASDNGGWAVVGMVTR